MSKQAGIKQPPVKKATKPKKPLLVSPPPSKATTAAGLIREFRKDDPHIRIVGEVKPFSPYKGFLNPRLEGMKLSEARLAILGKLLPLVDIVSIHIDEIWGGSFKWLAQAAEICRAARKPVLAKGFNPSLAHISQALNAGADYVLTVGWHPARSKNNRDKFCNVWHEPVEEEQFAKSHATTLVINSRNPVTGNDLDREQIITRVASMRALDKRIVQASNIHCAACLLPGVDYALVGEPLVKLMDFSEEKK